MHQDEPELAQVEAIYDALDSDDTETALRLARSAREEHPEDPVLRFLCGVALLEADRPLEAVEELRQAIELDPDDGEFQAVHSVALFRGGRFSAAEEAVRAALATDGDAAEVHHVHGLLLERRGDLEAADEALAKATSLDPDRFPAAVRLGRDEFSREVEIARSRLPEAFRQRLDGIAVIVDDLPQDELLFAEAPPLDPELLGLFSGTPLGAEAFDGPISAHPPQIHLFKRNLERFALARDELAEQIAITLYHELGHYLGMEEEDLEAVDFG